MNPIVWRDSPKLSSPLMVVALEGWFDAGNCATGAVEWMRQGSEPSRKIAEIDLEEFLDFQETRPYIVSTESGERTIEWPRVDCYVIQDTPRHDLILMEGIEPRMRWRSFSEAVLEVAIRTKSQMIVTLGSTAAGVPHTRPPSVKSSAANAKLAQRLRLDAPTYQGPTGIIGTLHDLADKASLPVISLRVGVPHYVAGPRNPKGIQALLAEFEHVTGVPTNHVELNGEILAWEQRVTEATMGDDEVMSYITQLEEESDRTAAQSTPSEDQLSGDQLAEEIEKYLEELGESG